MPVTLPFDGGFSTGNSSQWDATGATNGSVAVVSSYSGVTLPGGSSGGYMGHSTIGISAGNTRGEWASDYDYANFHTLTKYFTFAFCLDPAGNWSALNTDISLAQLMTRNLQAASLLLYLRPIGWQGTTTLSLAPLSWGGLTTAGVGAEQRICCDPALGNGWNTLLNPTTAENTGAQRTPQVMGSNTFSAGNVPVTAGDWHELIIEWLSYTSVASGYLKYYYRKKGSGPAWTVTCDPGITWKTVQYNVGAGQPIASSGGNNTQRQGPYASSGVPATSHIFTGNFSIQNNLAAAQAVFASEISAGGGGQAAYTVTTGGAVGL